MSEILDLMKLSEEQYSFYVNKVQWFNNDLCLESIAIAAHTTEKIVLEQTLYNIWFDVGTLLIHSENNPAIIGKGIEMWIIQGKRHRLYGPACVCYDGFFQNEYFIDGKKISSKEEWENEIYCLKYPELKPFL